MPVITPSTPSNSAMTSSSSAAGGAGAARQDDFARLMGQASERKGPADNARATAPQRQAQESGQKPAAQHKSRSSDRPRQSDTPQDRQAVDGTGREPAEATAKASTGKASGNKLPQDQDKGQSLKPGEEGAQSDLAVAPDWQAPQASDAAAESDAPAQAADAAQDVGQASDWHGDGEAWLAHLQASREQAAELARGKGQSSDPARQADGEPSPSDAVSSAHEAKPAGGHAKAAASKSAAAGSLSEGEMAPQAEAQSSATEESLAAEFAAATKQAVGQTAQAGEQTVTKPKGSHSVEASQAQNNGINPALAALQGAASAGEAQQGELKSAYLSGLASGGVAATAGNQTRGAGLGKLANAAIQQTGQPAGALVGQETTPVNDVDASPSTDASTSDQRLDQLSTSQGLAALTSQGGQASSPAGDGPSALSSPSASHGSPAQGAPLAQTPQLTEKSDRLPTALPTLSSFAMTANQNDNAEQLGQRLTLMLGQKWHEAELQLEPEGLGKMRIQLKMDQEQQAQVHIMVQHQQTKELVDQALPRLRDMLAGQGIQMSQAQVQQHSAGQQGAGAQGGQWGGQGQGDASGGGARGQSGATTEEPVAQTLAIHSTGSAGIDFYA
ncbi:flagellar hook-length control protein FliK [Pseudaeromonas paramecii]|uniref:Flagellar hook-length control protein FliK n=1 Tax=Pseudaeromonas paramecii TaxID=2138166 RepID=A0ABP8Q453_9GAMM